MEDRVNTNYVASAELICRRNLVLTAAHCIQDKTTGHLGDNYMFERCYNDGSSAEKLTFKTVALKASGMSRRPGSGITPLPC